MSAPVATEWSERLRRWEERALLGCFLSGSLGASYGLEEWLLLIPVALTAVLFPILRARRLRASQPVEGLVLALAGLAAIPIVIASHSPAPGLALFLIAAQGVKLLAPRTERDKGTACIVGMALAGVSASEAVEPPIAAILLASLTSTAAFAILRNLRFHGLPTGLPTGPAPLGPRWVGSVGTWRGARGLLRLGAAAAVGTTLLFFTFPRVGAKLFPSPRSTKARMAGFTDRVGLSDIGKIKKNDAVAFRVEAPYSRFGDDTYWKGRALDSYDGKSWRTSRLFNLTKQKLQQSGRLRFHDRHIKGDEGEKTETITFFLDPLGTRCLFTTGNVKAFQFKSSRPLLLTRDDMGAVLLGKPAAASIAYSTEAYGATASSLILSPARAFKVREHCLKIPGAVDRDRLQGYATRALRDARVAETAPPSAIAEGLAAHLRTRFRYTLEINNAGNTEPIGDFLYARREGHCELFASAHVMLLRARGIPARLITGFRGGAYSTWSESYTVRQRDAHAWVEALTEKGWETFDPTPAEAPIAHGSNLIEGLSNLKDWLELRWFSRVIAFDAYDQSNFLFRVQELVALRMGLEEHSKTVGHILAFGTLALIGGFIALLVWVLAHPWRRAKRERRARLHSQRPLMPNDAELAELLAVLATHGFHRETCETPMELAQRAATLVPGPRIATWVHSYYARRFGRRDGGNGHGNGNGNHLASLLRELREPETRHSQDARV